MRQEIVFFLLIFKKSDSRTIKFLVFVNLFPRKQVVGGSALLWLGRCGNLFNCPDFLFGLFSNCFFISLFSFALFALFSPCLQFVFCPFFICPFSSAFFSFALFHFPFIIFVFICLFFLFSFLFVLLSCPFFICPGVRNTPRVQKLFWGREDAGPAYIVTPTM